MDKSAIISYTYFVNSGKYSKLKNQRKRHFTQQSKFSSTFYIQTLFVVQVLILKRICTNQLSFPMTGDRIVALLIPGARESYFVTDGLDDINSRGEIEFHRSAQTLDEAVALVVNYQKTCQMRETKTPSDGSRRTTINAKAEPSSAIRH
jgi:hypothetical protein